MDKMVFKSGSPVTPEFLNALQDLSFKKAESEVGQSASSGALNIAYINLRGLAMRFGSYVNGSWVGQTLNKDGSYKLNITLRYTYTGEGDGNV